MRYEVTDAVTELLFLKFFARLIKKLSLSNKAFYFIFINSALRLKDKQ
jgi:hypothetical protein